MVLSPRFIDNLNIVGIGDQISFDRGPLSRDDLTSSTYSVKAVGDVVEGSNADPGPPQNIQFVIRRSGGLSSPGEVQFQVKSLSAKIGSDFLYEAGYQTISFPAEPTTSENSYQEIPISIPIVPDDDVEMDESLMAMLRSRSSSDRIAVTTAQAKIKNDDVVSRYSLSVDKAKVTEGSPFNLKIERSSALRPATIQLSLKGGSADSDVDFVDIGKKNLNFIIGQSEIIEPLVTIDDTKVEMTEGLFARIDSDFRYDQIVNGMKFLEIEDDDKPSQYSLVKPTTSVLESDSTKNLSFKVIRSGSVKTEGAFYFWTKNGTAKGDDYHEWERQKVVFPACVDPAVCNDPNNPPHVFVDVKLKDDSIVEADEFVYGFIKPFYKEDSIIRNTQKGIIADDDQPTKYSLDIIKELSDGSESKTTSFDEGDTVIFEISRSQKETAGSVRLKLRSATAQGKKDFIPPIVDKVQFPIGADKVRVRVPIKNDFIVEKDEMFFASLKTDDRADKVNGSGKNKKIKIIDDDTQSSYSLLFVSVAEDGTETEITGGKTAAVAEGKIAKFRIKRMGGNINAPGQVKFYTIQGSAKEYKDFTPKEKQLLDFKEGVQFVDVDVSTEQDYVIERDETFSAVIRAVAKQDKIKNRQQIVSIANDDQPAAFSFSSDSTSIVEGGVFKVNITKSGGEGRSSSVLLLTSNSKKSSGNAKPGKDYEKNIIQVDFGPDETTKTISIPTYDDTNVEDASETFFVNLKSLDSKDSFGWDKDNAKDKSKIELTIQDNDKPAKFSISPLSANIRSDGKFEVNEASDFSFTITKSGGEGRTSSVLLSTSDGSAKSGSDYIGLKNVQVDFDPSSGPVTRVVKTISDDEIEKVSGLGENFYIDIKAIDSADSIEGTPRVEVAIIDDDKPAEFSIVADNTNVSEGDSINFTVTKKGGEGRTSSVLVSTSDAKAKWGRDYEKFYSRLDFAEGDLSKTFSINTVEDLQIEQGSNLVEDFVVNIKQLDDNDLITGGSNLKIEITDNDKPAEFSVVPAAENLKNPNDSDQITVNEAGTISFTVNRSGGEGRTTSVLVKTKNGTAKAGSDYVGQKKEYTFGPSDTAPKTLTIPINSDESIEGGDGVGENFSIHVKPLDSVDTALKSKLEVTIVDDDEPAVFSVAADKTEVEEGGSIGFTISKSGGQGRTSSVVVSTSNGSAKWGSDYERLVPTQIDFVAGDTSKSVSVKTLTDDLNEKVNNTNENFYFVVKPLSSADSITNGDARLALTIADPVVGGSSQIV